MLQLQSTLPGKQEKKNGITENRFDKEMLSCFLKTKKKNVLFFLQFMHCIFS